MTRAAAILSLALLAGCASLSEAECLTGDWRAIGFEDGANGAPSTRIGDHRQACARHGVAPNLDLWRLGYEEGLPAYCTRANGFRVGATGATYHGVCTGPDSGAFLQALNDGGYLFEVRRELEAARSDLSSIDRDIDDLIEERNDAQARAADPATTDAERKELLDEIAYLSEDIGRLDRERDAVDLAIARIQNHVWAVESDMRVRYPEWRGY